MFLHVLNFEKMENTFTVTVIVNLQLNGNLISQISEMPLFLLKKEFLFSLTKSENFLFFFKIFNIF